MEQSEPADSRARRTHVALRAAFGRLALERRYDAIRIADIVADAGVGRATFYEHFGGKDALLLAAMAPLLHTLAQAAAGRASVGQLRAMLEHVWERRMAGRQVLGHGPAARQIERALAARIASSLVREGAPEGEARLVAIGRAAAQLAMLRAWLAGEIGCSADALARALRSGPRAG